MLVWSITFLLELINPQSDGLNQQIMHLTLDDDQDITEVVYSKHCSALVSCSAGHHINTWTAVKLPQIPPENKLWISPIFLLIHH